MKLRQMTIGALDGAFLMFARIGPSGRRKENAAGVLMLWISFFIFGVWFFINHWIYGVDSLYLKWWPYRSKNFYSPFSTYFALGTAILIPALWVAYRTSKRCSHRIDYTETTTREWIYHFIRLFAIGFGTLPAANRYGSILVVLAHVAAFYFVSRYGSMSKK
jgi:hypothetical protein